MSWSDDTRCLYYDGKLPLFRKLAQGQFCSKPHQEAYWKEQDQLAVESLHRTHDAIQAYKPTVPIESILGPAPAPVAVPAPAPVEMVPEIQGLTRQPGLGHAIAPRAAVIAATDPVEYELRPSAAGPRHERGERAAGELSGLAGLVALAQLHFAVPEVRAAEATTLETPLEVTSPELPAFGMALGLRHGAPVALPETVGTELATPAPQCQPVAFETPSVRDVALTLAPRTEVLELLEDATFPPGHTLLGITSPRAANRIMPRSVAEFKALGPAGLEQPQFTVLAPAPRALAAAAGMFDLAGNIPARNWIAPLAAPSSLDPRCVGAAMDTLRIEARPSDAGLAVDLLASVGCAPQCHLPYFEARAAADASRPVNFEAFPATSPVSLPVSNLQGSGPEVRSQASTLFQLDASGTPRTDLRLRSGFVAEPLSGEVLLPHSKLQPRKLKSAPEVEAALMSSEAPVRRMVAGVSDFWNHAPRDLKMLLFAVPLALGLAFHPSLPKVSVQSPSGNAQAFTSRVQAAMDTQMASLRKTMADRAAVGLDENFRQGLDNWMSHTGSTAEWSFDQAGFVQPGRVALYQPSLGLTDYEFQFLGAIDKGALSWVARASDFQNYYVVKLVKLSNGPVPTMGITRYAVIDGKPVDRVDTPVSFQARTDSLYRVSMVMEANHYSLVIQGQMIDSWNEPRLKRGGIGFFTNRGEQSRIGWVQITHQYDTLGRLFAYLAP